MDSVLDNIGGTPLIRLDRLRAQLGLKCQLYAKCEFFNAGGSVKDRIGLRMVEDAEKSGRIKPGDTLIEPTSGNTGIGLALAAAIKGYRMIITLPEKMSMEKVNVMKLLGCEIIRTPTEAAFDSPESHISVAARLNQEIPNSHILDQYANPGNPLAHYDHTGEEIWKQCKGKIDMCVMTAGTGGTITGTAKKLKEKNPKIKIVGVDPHGSILAQPESLNTTSASYKVEGIGYDFIPKVLEREYVDVWYKSNDKDSFAMARKLITVEGLLCGGSCGAAMAIGVEAAKELTEDQVCVVLLADSSRNYMSKFISDDWMIESGFLDEQIDMQQQEWWWSKKISDIKLQAPVTIRPSVTCGHAINILKTQGIDQIPVVSDSNQVLGVITEGNLMANLTKGKIVPDDLVEKAIFKQFHQVPLDTEMIKVSKLFDRNAFVLVTTTQKAFIDKDTVVEHDVICGVLTRIDLLDYISKKRGSSSADLTKA